MIVNRKTPKNLKTEDLWIFRHELKKEFDDPLVLDLKNVIITGDLYFDKKYKNNIILSYHGNFYNATFLQLIKKITSFHLSFKFKKYSVISDNWSSGYFHWLLDCLPRLILLEGLGINLPLALPSYLKGKTFVTQSLTLLDKTNYEFLKKEKWYFFKSLCFPAHLAPTGNYNDEIINKLRSRLTGNCKEVPTLKIYVSRSKASRRKIVNEQKIFPCLSSMGFRTVFCEDLTFEEQVQLFSKVKYLISNHGAGLSNILFMAPETSVLELRKRNDNHNNCYFSLASSLNLKYFYLECAPVNSTEETHIADIIVNTYEFSQQVKRMINEK